MRMTVEAPFDLGVTLGLGNSVFQDNEKLDLLRAKSASLFQASVEALNQPLGMGGGDLDDFSHAAYGIRAPYGFGARFKVSGGSFLDVWKENACSFWHAFEDSLCREFGRQVYYEVREKLPAVNIPYALVCAFELGLGYVRLHLEPPLLATPNSVLAIFKAFENAGYGDFVSGDSANTMLASWRQAVRETYGEASAVTALTERALPPQSVEIAGFQGVVFVPGDAARAGMSGLFRSGDAEASIRYGDLTVTATWLMTLVQGTPGFEYDYKRFLHLGMCNRLSWEACRIFEGVFAEKMRLSIRASIENDRMVLSRRQLSRIRQLAALILSTTSVDNLSDYSSDMEFAMFFDRYANITKRQQRIALASEALGDVEADIAVTDERRQSRAMNGLLLALTIVSLIGVSAGVVQSWESGLQLFQSQLLLLLTLTGPSLLTVIAVLAARARQR